MKIIITDEQINGTILNELSLELQGQTLTVRELIELRVTKEVELYNSSPVYSGLVTPTAQEATLNAKQIKMRPQVDAEKQVYIALDAFQKNGFFIIVDNEQVEELDHQLQLNTTSKISFLKLTQLIGG